MFQIPGVSSSGNRGDTIGATFTGRTWNATTTSQRLVYANGFWFGGQGTSSAVKYLPSINNSSAIASSGEGTGSILQCPSFYNGNYIMPVATSTARQFLYTTALSNTTWTAVNCTGSTAKTIVRVIWTGTYYVALGNAGEFFRSTTINGTWASRTGASFSISAAESNLTRNLLGGASGELARIGDGGGDNETAITSPFGTSTVRMIRWWENQNTWTASTTDGKLGYSVGVNGDDTSWALITHNLGTNNVDPDLFFINGRWAAIGSNAGGTSTTVSISANSSITSTYTSQGAKSTAAGDASAGSWASDGNYIGGILGNTMYYTR